MKLFSILMTQDESGSKKSSGGTKSTEKGLFLNYFQGFLFKIG
jgi:hypothetical protein